MDRGPESLLAVMLVLLGAAVVAADDRVWAVYVLITAVYLTASHRAYRRRRRARLPVPDPTVEPLAPGDPYYVGSTQDWIDTTDDRLTEDR